MQTLRHFIDTRPRLACAIGLGLAVMLLSPARMHPITRALTGWNVMVWSYLCLMGWLMVRASHTQIRAIAEKEDRGAVVVLSAMSLVSIASLAAIIFELSRLNNLSWDEKLLHYLLTGLTVFGSWCLVAVLFTFHYALVFYRSPHTQRALAFPEHEENPDYWDFLYFSFTIAVAAQTSDISIMSRSMRKTVLAQSVLSFLFNVAILGLTINIAAGIVGA
jgi:uncharacterized membrane protein